MRTGPLKADRFRRAKTRLADGDVMRGADSLKVLTEPLPWLAPWTPRTSRILFGKRVDVLGVVGRTLIEVCGDREKGKVLIDDPVGVTTVSMLLEETEDVFECECAW